MDREKISLRPLKLEDQATILEILTSNIVNQTYMLPDFEKQEDAIPLFNRLMTISSDSSRFVRCIAHRNVAVGFLNDVEIHDGTIELGYVVHPQYHNRGFMTAALKAAIEELYHLGYREVICGAFEHNKASLRVMEKVGMTLMNKTDDVTYRGSTHLCIYYHARNEE